MADLKKDTVKEEKIVKGENAAPDTTILPEEFVVRALENSGRCP